MKHKNAKESGGNDDKNSKKRKISDTIRAETITEVKEEQIEQIEQKIEEQMKVQDEYDDEEDGGEEQDNIAAVTFKKGGKEKEERRKCPYLDTVNRQLLDFDMEKVCSVTLSNLNVYCCLICGKYFQGRGKSTPAYTHSVAAGKYDAVIHTEISLVFLLEN